jgi:fluoride ion exporter CrcB/FEX
MWPVLIFILVFVTHGAGARYATLSLSRAGAYGAGARYATLLVNYRGSLGFGQVRRRHPHSSSHRCHEG